ncbi:uncharacterized protein [Rutidosis leptorrhynchoides]|uniref:uncharacterized protein n=1 Tax=Rutidosis leptorrhynchoides TaxID=125765 RepID=UPI003A99F3F7
MDIQIDLTGSSPGSIQDSNPVHLPLEMVKGSGSCIAIRVPPERVLESVKQISIKDRVTSADGAASYSWSNNSDSWTWTLATNVVLTVKKLADFIDEKLLNSFISQQQYIQNSLIPKKIEIFIWRTIFKRLPVIELHSVRCPVCDGDVESVRVAKWWNVCNFSISNLAEFLKEAGPASTSTLGKKIFQAMIWSCTYLIWKNRNNMVFQGKSWSTSVALNEIQTKSFDWIAPRFKEKKLDWLSWISNPSVYLSS